MAHSFLKLSNLKIIVGHNIDFYIIIINFMYNNKLIINVLEIILVEIVLTNINSNTIKCIFFQNSYLQSSS